jgi:hypothetical protein
VGYGSESNVWELRKLGIYPYIPPRRMTHGEVVIPPRGRMPCRLSFKEAQAPDRAGARRVRVAPEPVFGQIKQARGFRQFLRRGTRAVRQEWGLISTAHNLLKLYVATT